MKSILTAIEHLDWLSFELTINVWAFSCAR